MIRWFELVGMYIIAVGAISVYVAMVKTQRLSWFGGINSQIVKTTLDVF